MNYLKSVVLALIALTSTVSVAFEITLNQFNPVVVNSVPVAGATTVDPAITEIAIKFSNEMMTDNMWSLVQVNGANFPKITGQVYFKSDKRTFVIPVNLERDTVYGLSINSVSKHGFKSVHGQTAQPYIIAFKTK